MNLEKIYRYALKREEEGRDFFQANAEKMSHAAAQGVFEKLVEEENRHIRFIQALLKELDGEPAGKIDELEQDGVFAQHAEEELLDQSIIESMTPDVAILRTAFLIERDFAEFYEMAAKKTEGRAKMALESLANWERSHERLFKRLHDKVFEEYTQMPWGG